MNIESKLYYLSKSNNPKNHPLNNNGCAEISREKPQVPVFSNKEYLDKKRRMKKIPARKGK